MERKALIIDDSKSLRTLLRIFLEAKGFEITEAPNGRKGFEELERMGKCHLILLDWYMPVMNGQEFIKALEKDPAYSSIPLMMVTTQANIEDVQGILQEGFREYLKKPFTPEGLYEKLALLGF